MVSLKLFFLIDKIITIHPIQEKTPCEYVFKIYRGKTIVDFFFLFKVNHKLVAGTKIRIYWKYRNKK